MSKHLESCIEVADILKAGPVPITDLRTAMIPGSGSAAFEILRYYLTFCSSYLLTFSLLSFIVYPDQWSSIP
ncbi:MAG: hypothetical protein JRE36_14210 [Deltaproteobacteria bacterium]|nr:hypothetical protein [Deltaproteobacteria bacterium]